MDNALGRQTLLCLTRAGVSCEITGISIEREGMFDFDDCEKLAAVSCDPKNARCITDVG